MIESLPLAGQLPVLVVTASAAEQFERMRAKRNKFEAVLRVRVVPDSGCGDYRYAMGIEPGPREEDLTIDSHGIQVIIDPASVDLLRGSTLDYSDALIDGGFKLNNPNANSACGCGQSFTTSGRAVVSEHKRGAISI
jgi:iron-sulfur cluster assembly protein